MGFFSWNTQNTNKSIANTYSGRNTFPVAMVSDTGEVFIETNYEGYGDFGKKDYYELLGEMNGLTVDCNADSYNDKMRGLGIDLAFDSDKGGENPNCKHPVLVEITFDISNESEPYTEETIAKILEIAKPFIESRAIPTRCKFQGYFYDD